MKPPKMPSKPLTAPEAATFINEKYGLTITRQTVCNWIKKGRFGNNLTATSEPNGYRIEKGVVDEFVQNHVL